jgi:hypothetical protein
MNQESKISALLALHAPECVAQSMVYLVFQDGEVCLTKGADLFMQRSLHCQVPGVDQVPGEAALPAEAMPMKLGKNGYIVARGRLEALTASALIAGPKGYAQHELTYASKCAAEGDLVPMQMLA